MILVTGGLGFIGAHTVVELLGAGHEVLVYDNLSNSHLVVLERITAITGRAPLFIEGDVRDREGLNRVFASHSIGSVLHFAGLKSVGESVSQPLAYFDNNVQGSLVLLQAMAAHGVKRLVFSSSATVYGNPDQVPIREDAPTRVTNPYGRTKLMVEDICRDLCASDPTWRFALLRYFNPVGAHPSGLIGEDPRGIPNNLMPYIARVAAGRLPELQVFGDDYPTPDGTGVRDYIHVQDLARGHLAALDYLARTELPLDVFNLGTGQGYSVLEVVRAFAAASGREVPYGVAGHRPGDVASCYADSGKAKRVLGWEARLGLEDMCRSAWRFTAGTGND